MNLAKVKTMLLGKLLAPCVGKTDPGLWVFSSKDNTQFNYNSKYLFLYVKEKHPELTPRYVMNDKEKRRELAKRYGEEFFIDTTTFAGAKEALRAGVWFTSAGLPIYGSGLKKKRRIVNLWHGVPLKKIALEDPSLDASARAYFKRIFSDNYSDVLTTSESFRAIMAQSLGVSEDLVKVWGQPRNDCLFDEKARERLEAICRRAWGSKMVQSPTEAKNEKLESKKEVLAWQPLRYILYAPTFRSGKPVELFPFADYDKDDLDAFLAENGCRILIRTHLDEVGRTESYESEYVRFLNEDKVEDIMEVLGGIDLLITDYSSIFIDYMLLERPIVFLPYDLEDYQSGHGFNLDYEELLADYPHPDSMQKLMEEIKSNHDMTNAFAKWNAFFHEINSPCCERICREIRKES